MKDTRQRPKALPSAQAMALGKQLKELKKYIYKHGSASMITIFETAKRDKKVIYRLLCFCYHL